MGATVSAVPVGAGSAIRINLTLSIQRSFEAVDLFASTVATTEPSASELLDDNVIHNLPIEGRRFQDLTVLAPGIDVLIQTRGQLSFPGEAAPPSRFPNPGTSNGAWGPGAAYQQGTPLQPQSGARVSF